MATHTQQLWQQPLHRHTRRGNKINVATQAFLLVATIPGASSVATTTASVIVNERSTPQAPVPLFARHGDPEYEKMTAMDMMSSTFALVSPVLSSAVQPQSTTQAGSMHLHNHDSDSDSHKHSPNPYDGVADAHLQDIHSFISIPPRPVGSGSHYHGGRGEAKVDLNETAILRSKGPDPLSYVEWDFAYGIGTSDNLLRFSSAEQESLHVMGVGGGRWRTLLDEKDGSVRKSIALEIQQRVQNSAEDPGRHRTLLILHVIGCIVSCFVLLPLGE